MRGLPLESAKPLVDPVLHLLRQGVGHAPLRLRHADFGSIFLVRIFGLAGNGLPQSNKTGPVVAFVRIRLAIETKRLLE